MIRAVIGKRSDMGTQKKGHGSQQGGASMGRNFELSLGG